MSSKLNVRDVVVTKEQIYRKQWRCFKHVSFESIFVLTAILIVLFLKISLNIVSLLKNAQNMLGSK